MLFMDTVKFLSFHLDPIPLHPSVPSRDDFQAPEVPHTRALARAEARYLHAGMGFHHGTDQGYGPGMCIVYLNGTLHF